jgi:TPR repeat protein
MALLAGCAVPLTGKLEAQNVYPTVSVGPTISAEPGAQAPLTIRIGPPEAVPKGSFVRIQGLPPTVALSEGYSVAPGSWAVPIAALPNLKLTLPASASGKSDVSIRLVALDGAILSEATSTLVVTAPPPVPVDSQARARSNPSGASILRVTPTAPAPERAEPPLTSAPPAISGEQRERALRLLKRGNEQVAEGGIAQARLLFERAAEAGLAQGAMALAATYDPVELERLGVQGLKPDRAEAARWYEKARQMGAAEAEQRLRRLRAN